MVVIQLVPKIFPKEISMLMRIMMLPNVLGRDLETRSSHALPLIITPSQFLCYGNCFVSLQRQSVET
jgi:hypothetical protein